jgi:hypothetical protein
MLATPIPYREVFVQLSKLIFICVLNDEQEEQVCDATGVDRIAAAGNTIIIYHQRTFPKYEQPQFK